MMEVEKICHKTVTKIFNKNFTCPPVKIPSHCFASPSSPSAIVFQGSGGIGGSSPPPMIWARGRRKNWGEGAEVEESPKQLSSKSD